MMRKFIRALLGKGEEEYEVNLSLKIDLVDFLFILAFIVLTIWMIL